MFHKPHPLRPGDRVRLVAPASAFDRQSFERGIDVLRQRYELVYDEGIFARERYLAGSDARRLSELSRALEEQTSAAVYCVRGGYGVTRFLRGLAVERAPLKPLVGFSDISALHALWQSRERVSIHGPVLTQLGREPPHSVQRLFRLLESTEPAEPITGSRCLVPGVVEGPLLGGNLSIVSRLLGTPYLPDLRGAVLLLEDVGERPYRLDRMWQHLAMAGVFERIVGIVLGEFAQCEEKDGAWSSAEILAELAGQTRIPCASGFLIGHGATNLAVPLGCRVRLNADAATLEFLEAAASPRVVG